MFLKNLKNITGKIGFRLTVWHSGLIIASVLILFQSSYYFLDSSLRNRDIQEIESEASEFTTEFKDEGITGLRSFIQSHLSKQLRENLFIRIADKDNKTINFFPSMKLEGNVLFQLERIPYEEDAWLTLNQSGTSYSMDILTCGLGPGIIIQVGMNNKNRKGVLRHFRQLFVTGITPLIIIGIIFSIFLSSQNLKPIRYIINTVQSIDIGKMDTRVPRTGNGDELDELAKLFNEMLDKIGYLITGMKDSLDNVAHDLKTPLTRLRNTAEQALNGMDLKNENRETYESILEESERILKMLDTLMDISEAETGVMNLDKEALPLKDLIIPIYELYTMVAETKRIHITCDFPDNLIVHADHGRISQVIANLLDNAVKFTPENGSVVIKAFEVNGHIHINISDTGIGIPENEIDRIYDRLYRGDQSRSQKGQGLGLSLVKAIVNAHNGNISVESIPEKGTSFHLILPSHHVQ